MRSTILGRFTQAKGWMWLIVFMAIPAAKVMAQPDDYGSGDTGTQYDYYDENIDGADSYGYDDEPEKPKKPEKKPYVRIKMPVDSISELITYDSVVVQDESYYDSLYIRAKRWATNKWFPGEKEKNLVKLFSDDVLYEKFKVKVTLPMRVRHNKYSVTDYGKVEFNLTMRFKDGKYKFTVSNMVHLLPETSDKKDINYVYLEYYMKSERNILNYDRYLRGADAAVRKMIIELTKVMREPVEVDEDEW